MAAAPKPPIGTVIQQSDGSHSIWTGTAFAPAKAGPAGWGIDQEAMARVGLGGNGKGGVISPIEQKRVDDMRQSFGDVDGLANNANEFARLNAGTPTGGVLAIPGATTVAKALPFTSPDLGAMTRINNTMATQMRAPGMRLTQMEFGKFLGSTPSPTMSEDKNKSITKDINSARTLAAAQTAFYSSWLNSHRTLDGVEPAWLNFRGQHFDPTLSNYSHAPLQGGAMPVTAPALGAPATTPAAPAPPAQSPADYQAYLRQKFAQ